jgi:hypothetical protein
MWMCGEDKAGISFIVKYHFRVKEMFRVIFAAQWLND